MAESHALFAACHEGLVRYLAGAVGHRETARDLAQDVFVRVAAADTLPATVEGRRAWVFHIARNIAIDHHRRQRHRQVSIEIPMKPWVTSSGDVFTLRVRTKQIR